MLASKRVRSVVAGLAVSLCTLAAIGCERSRAEPDAGVADAPNEADPPSEPDAAGKPDAASEPDAATKPDPPNEPGAPNEPNASNEPSKPVPPGFEVARPSSKWNPFRAIERTDELELILADAELIQLEGDRLYALSRNTGLAVIDVTNPKQLALIGRYRALPGLPFELRVRGNLAILVYTDWAQRVERAPGRQGWVETSKVVALDVADAAAIGPLSGFDVPGTIIHAHFAGDTLYTVSRTDGRDAVLSIDLRDARQLRKVDELRYADTRVISANERRMFLARPNGGGSLIQVIDIADPNGDLVEGALLTVTSPILRRDQLGEYQNILRVVGHGSQDIHSAERSRVETFEIVSSGEIRRLAEIPLRLATPAEGTLSIHLDGSRGYVITGRRAVLLLDLSSPAAPVQVEPRELPARLANLLPHGNRLITVEDSIETEPGVFRLALFDVSDLRMPKLLSQLRFDGIRSEERQVHELLQLASEQQLIFVPGSAASDQPFGGLQVVNYANDRLTSRGTIWRGTKRALVHRGHVLAASENEVATFDLGQPNTLPLSSRLVLSRQLIKAAQLADGRVVRLNQRAGLDTELAMEVAARDRAEDFHAQLSSLSLSVLGDERSGNFDELHVVGSKLFSEGMFWDEPTSSWGSMFVSLDAVDTTARVVSRTTWGAQDWQDYRPHWPYGTLSRTNWFWSSDVAVKLECNSNLEPEKLRMRARVVDLRDTRGLHTAVVPLPTGEELYPAAVLNGSMFVTSRIEPHGSSLRVFAERIDLSDPSAPVTLPAINVPGIVIHYDQRSARAVILDTQRVVVDNISAEACAARFASHEPIEQGKSCTGYVQRLHLADMRSDRARIEDTFELNENEWTTAFSAGDGTVFLALGRTDFFVSPGANAQTDCAGHCSERELVELLSLRGFDAGELQVGRLTLELAADGGAGGGWGAVGLEAFGQRALLVRESYVAVVDATDVQNPRITKVEALRGPVKELDIREDRALLTLDFWGLQTLEL